MSYAFSFTDSGWNSQTQMMAVQFLWETAKAVLGVKLSPTYLNTEKRSKMRSVLGGKHIRTFWLTLQAKCKTHWHNAKLAYDAWLEKGEGFCHTQQEANLFRLGNKTGRLLAKYTTSLGN